jgi:hypothetical protein
MSGVEKSCSVQVEAIVDVSIWAYESVDDGGDDEEEGNAGG